MQTPSEYLLAVFDENVKKWKEVEFWPTNTVRRIIQLLDDSCFSDPCHCYVEEPDFPLTEWGMRDMLFEFALRKEDLDPDYIF